MHAHGIAATLCDRCREGEVRVLGIHGGRLCASCGLDDVRAHQAALRDHPAGSHHMDRAS